MFCAKRKTLCPAGFISAGLFAIRGPHEKERFMGNELKQKLLELRN